MPFRNKPLECLCVFFCSTWVFPSKILYRGQLSWNWARTEEAYKATKPLRRHANVCCVGANIKKVLFHSVARVLLHLWRLAAFFSPRIMECGSVEIRLIRAFQNWMRALWEWPRWQSCLFSSVSFLLSLLLFSRNLEFIWLVQFSFQKAAANIWNPRGTCTPAKWSYRSRKQVSNTEVCMWQLVLFGVSAVGASSCR